MVDVKLNDELVVLLKDDNTLWMLGHQESRYFGSPIEQDTVYTEPQLVATDVQDFWLTNKRLYVRRHDDESI